MINRRIAGPIALLYCLSAICAFGAPPAKDKAPEYLDKLGKEVLAEINLARTKPRDYVKHLEEHLSKFQDGLIFTLPDGAPVKTIDGTNAVMEAIAFLKKQQPLSPLVPSRGLSKAAADHAKDIGEKGLKGNHGSDKSQPTDRMNRYGKVTKAFGENIAYGRPDDARLVVIQFIVDDGVTGRPQRKNIFNSDLKFVGIAHGPHKTLNSVCVADFGGQYQE